MVKKRDPLSIKGAVKLPKGITKKIKQSKRMRKKKEDKGVICIWAKHFKLNIVVRKFKNKIETIATEI